MSGFPKGQAPDYGVEIITGAAEVDIDASYVVGAKNLAPSAQAVSIQIFDGTSSAGTQVAAANLLGTNSPAQDMELPEPGIRLTTGTLGIKPSGAPTAPGIAVYYVK